MCLWVLPGICEFRILDAQLLKNEMRNIIKSL